MWCVYIIPSHCITSCAYLSTDHQFQLAEYSSDIRKFTGNVFDSTDRHFAWVASYIKRSVPERWLPEQARPPPPPSYRLTDGTYIEQLQDWMSRNRALSAAIVAFITTGGLLLWRESVKNNRKRRARRASNGARKEVVGTNWSLPLVYRVHPILIGQCLLL